MTHELVRGEAASTEPIADALLVTTKSAGAALVAGTGARSAARWEPTRLSDEHERVSSSCAAIHGGADSSWDKLAATRSFDRLDQRRVVPSVNRAGRSMSAVG